MTIIIKPFIERKPEEYFTTTNDRYLNLFTPIQMTHRKKSDFMAYITTPLIDAFILEPVFALDACIHFLNAVASVVKGLQLWTLNQKHTVALIDRDAAKEFMEAKDHLTGCCAAIFAQTLNSILSTMALFTRPIGSLIEAGREPRPEHFPQQVQA